MSIQIAKEGHVKDIQSLVKSLAHFYLSDSKGSLPEWFENTLTLKSFSERITNPLYRNYIYSDGGQVIGYISLKGEGHLFHLFVSESYHGKGIARKLWDHLRKEASHSQYTLRSSLYAVPIYKKLGFSECGEVGIKDGIGFQPMLFQEKC